MTSLAQTTTIWTVVVGLACAAYAVLGRPRPRVLQASLAVSGVAAVGVALADLGGMVLGRVPGELATHVGYLVTVPLVLPVTAGLAGHDRGRWGSACFATACAVLVVVLLRLVVTSRA